MIEIKIDKYKSTMPLITDEELMKVDNCLEQLVQEFIQTKIHDKDLLICQHIIEKLQKEISELKAKNENLTNMVCNKLIADYDYSSPLKDELNKTRVRNIVLKNANNETNKENDLLKSVIDEVREVINKMIYTGYVLENNNTATQFMATNKNSEFGKRAEVLLQILDKGADK